MLEHISQVLKRENLRAVIRRVIREYAMPADMAAAYTAQANAARTRLDLENIIITMQQELGE